MRKSQTMKCVMCGNTSFQNIDIIDRDNCDSGGGWGNTTGLQADAYIEEFPNGNATPNSWSGQQTNWEIESKVCLSCGYIVSFLPFDELRRKKENAAKAAAKKAKAAAKKKAEARKRKEAEKKAAIEAEKERLKKRLSELEDTS